MKGATATTRGRSPSTGTTRSSGTSPRAPARLPPMPALTAGASLPETVERGLAPARGRSPPTATSDAVCAGRGRSASVRGARRWSGLGEPGPRRQLGRVYFRRRRDRGASRAGLRTLRSRSRREEPEMQPGAVTADGRARMLADGNEIPLFGLGVWQVPNGPECENAVRWALELGYRHIDTAQAYGNEKASAAASATAACRATRSSSRRSSTPDAQTRRPRRSGAWNASALEHVDLYIVHWPLGGPTRAWRGMERAHERGYARSIGVSNYSASELDELMAAAETRPVVNQVQFSPFKYRRKLLEACGKHNVALEAYSPLGTGRHLSDTRVQQIARAGGTHTGPGPTALVPAAGSSSSSRSPHTATESTRTPASSTSPCPTRT